MQGSRSKRLKMIGLCVVAGLAMAGCSGPWKRVPHQLSGHQWTFRPPEGWMHLTTLESEMLSRDGPYLAYILAQSRPLDQGFRFTRQKLHPAMLPHEAARVITDNLHSDPLIRQFELLACEPAMVDGHTGFRLVYRYRDSFEVAIKTVYYGVVLADRFFNLRYTAAERHYFEKEWPAFSHVLNSLRLSPG